MVGQDSLADGKGKPGKAVEEATRAIEIDSNYADAYFHRGNAHRMRRRREEAILDFESALRVAPPGWPPRAQAEKMLDQLRRMHPRDE